MRIFALLIHVVLLAACEREEPSRRSEKAERGIAAVSPSPTDCRPVSDEFVVPIAASERDLAVARLGRSELVELSSDETATLLDRDVLKDVSIADELALERIAQLKTDRSIAYDRHVGSWTPSDEEELDQLVKRQAKPRPQSKPYLVKAVAGFEGTGHFYASTCTGFLRVDHGSLGHRAPTPSVVPVIVFLDRAPTRVRTAFFVDE